MEEATDPIKALLEKTGLSCDDLLQKLLAFKSQEKQSTTEIINYPEKKNEVYVNCDGISSGKTNDSSTNGASNLDLGHSSNCNNEEECSSKLDRSSDSNIISICEIPNSTKAENCRTPESSEKFCEKQSDCVLETTSDSNSKNINMESQLLQINVEGNMSKDYENSSQRNLNSVGVFTTNEENPTNFVTKETYNKTSDEENTPKNYKEEIPKNVILINKAPELHIALGKGENEIESVPQNVSYNEEIHSSERNCLKDDKNEETRNLVGLTGDSSMKTENLSNQSSNHNSALISEKRKSISDELVRRLVQRVSEDEMKVTEDEYIEEKQIKRNTDQVSETSGDIMNGVEKRAENDIEVCQVENFEVVEPVQKLKLRKDLFEIPDDMKGSIHSERNYDNSKSDVDNTFKQDFCLEKVNRSRDINILENILVDHVYATDTTNRKIREDDKELLKKKILHKAIRHLSKADTKKNGMKRKKTISATANSKNDIDYSFQMPLPKSMLEPHVDTPEAQEEIRKNLKLQLNSLRNRKKTSNIIEQGQSNTVQSISDLKFNYKKQLLNEEVQKNSSLFPTSSSSVCTDIGEPQTSSSCVRIEDSTDKLTEVSKNDVSSLFSLSEETSFMIVDVQGGVEFPENDVDDRNKEFHDDAIKLTKTNDITKIKGWKNKKFDVVNKGSNYENQQEETYACDKLSATNINKDDSDSVETLKMDENSTEELSPFVSNTLEEFLTENSTLNISYKIPKLGAEEGLRESSYKEIVLPKTSDHSQTPETGKKDKPKGIKPKTLAEKRRMLEGKITKKGNTNKEDKPAIYQTSYVYFNGCKIFIPSTTRNKCLANITFKPSRCSKQGRQRENEITTPKKLSLLKLWLEKSNLVEYKPGPLSQKRKLQNSETISSWDTVVQKLPKVKLEIIQEFGKKIPPYLVPFLPKPGADIKNDYLEFALSAVHTKSSGQTSQGFRFSIPYSNNQKYILMRKKKDNCGDNIVCDIHPEKNSVASVLNDIISYVEIKEIGDSIINDAEPYEEDEYEVEPKQIMRNDINIVEDNIVKKNIKRRKWEMELQRLSCKVVSVTVEDKEIVDADCNKSYCKFGCICRSLAGASVLPLHCSKKDCMFGCKCSANSEIFLSGDSSLLSSDTVTRIEDQAKRNLAKVEKEFTQTIIHANNKTLLIPSSGRSKAKRVKRAPKRYTDFLEDYDVETEKEIASEEIEKSKVWTDSVFDYCYIQVQKLNLKSVVPLCLDHNCYYCSCIDSAYSKTEDRRTFCTDEESIEENVSPKKSKPPRAHGGENTIDEPNVKLKDQPSSGNSSEIDSSQNTSIYASRTMQLKEGCARIRGVLPEFVARNELPYYKNKLRSRIKNTESPNTFIHPLIPNLNYTEANSSIIDVTTPIPISGCDRLKLLQNECTQHKRKQVHEIRDDSELDFSLNKMKKFKKRHKNFPVPFSEHVEEDIQTDLPYNSIFDGEIVIPTSANKDFVKNLGVKSVAPYMRLLPWNDLLRNYYTFKINIWCSSEKNEKLLINRSHFKPPEGYVDIKESKRKNGIMMWILAKELPNQTPAELVHLILSPNNQHFEISGICLKNIPSSQEKRKTKKVIDNEYTKNDLNQTEKVGEIVKVNGDTEEPQNDDPNFLQHKNHNNELNVLSLTQHEFCPQYFHLAPICEGMSDEKFPLAIELPVIRPQFRWRMLYLNSNFSFLSFINNKYSIKYTDLMHILKKAQNLNKTICLQSKQLSSGYSQKNYGIYAVPKYRDRLFIGPYKHDERHGLETLRYLRQSLVSTSYFESVQGGSNPNNKNALWLTTRMSKLRNKKYSARILSLLDPPSQWRLLQPKNKIHLDKKESTEIYNKYNEDFAELTPILRVTSPISDTRSSVSSVAVPSSELAPILKVPSPISDTRSSVSPIAVASSELAPILKVTSPISDTRSSVSSVAVPSSELAPILKVTSPISDTRFSVSSVAVRSSELAPILKVTSPISDTRFSVSSVAVRSSELTPILKVTSPISDTRFSVSSVAVRSSELTPTLKGASPISDTSSSVSSVAVPSPQQTSTTTPRESNRKTDQKNELQQLREHSMLLEGCDSFISSTDLEEKPFIKFPEFILLNGRKMKPQEYNRYIMTNIPHFGYLGAIQNEQSKSIDIAWPFGNKILRFPNVTAATEFLKRRFTNLLLPVPTSFQINLIILTSQTSKLSPIDVKILSGTYICGEFGVVDSRKLTPSLAESLGTTQEDVLKRLAKRAQYLGALEIGKLREQEKGFVQIKKDLIIRKQNNLTKFMELLMHLPEKQRLKEYDKFRHQFNGRSKSSSAETTTTPSASKDPEVIECIEIDDSDSENETSNVTAGTKHIIMPKEQTHSPMKQFVMKSVLKPMKPFSPMPVPSSGQTSMSHESYKFVKTSTGKLVLLKDTSGHTLSTSLSGMKMTIRNNQVIRRDEIISPNDSNNAIQDKSIHGKNYQDNEVVVKNSERDHLVTLGGSDSDLEQSE